MSKTMCSEVRRKEKKRKTKCRGSAEMRCPRVSSQTELFGRGKRPFEVFLRTYVCTTVCMYVTVCQYVCLPDSKCAFQTLFSRSRKHAHTLDCICASQYVPQKCSVPLHSKNISAPSQSDVFLVQFHSVPTNRSPFSAISEITFPSVLCTSLQ